MDNDQLLAGRRDATFVRSPGRAEVAHIAVTDNGDDYYARCAPGRHLHGQRCIPLTMLDPAEQIHPNARCRHPGCRVAWPDYRPAPSNDPAGSNDDHQEDPHPPPTVRRRRGR